MDFDLTHLNSHIRVHSGQIGGNQFYWGSKRVFDILIGFALLPIFVVASVFLLLLNPFFNKGSLFFVQTRMGRDCQPFQAIKFRSMRAVDNISRGPDDPLEVDRITKLGRFLRKSRLDEIPQILNVFLGDMSLIGPRPDYYEHAKSYLKVIPGYYLRHSVRPGISGLAQTKLGYVEGNEATKAKVMADLEYIQSAGFQIDAKVFVATISTVLGRAGA